jgi:putative PIN family toxin of toxin-antitoxin system
MSPESRFVFDTNAIVNGLLFEDGIPAEAFFGALERGVVLLSQATFAELGAVLGREKFDRYVTREKREQFLVMLLRDATVVEVDEQIRECRDPKDDKFLEVEVSGNAECVVTGDMDLLVLHPYRGISIITPAEFIQQFLVS